MQKDWQTFFYTVTFSFITLSAAFFQKRLSVLPKKRIPFYSAVDGSLFPLVFVTVPCKTTLFSRDTVREEVPWQLLRGFYARRVETGIYLIGIFLNDRVQFLFALLPNLCVENRKIFVFSVGNWSQLSYLGQELHVAALVIT